jgi:hypothetical protein
MADIRAVELIVMMETQPNEKGNCRKLRLVQWVVDGESKSIKLEKRNFFTDEYGNQKTGKCDGLRLDDLEACKPHWTKIMELMKNPPAVKSPELEQAVAQTKEVMPGSEEIPF